MPEKTPTQPQEGMNPDFNLGETIEQDMHDIGELELPKAAEAAQRIFYDVKSLEDDVKSLEKDNLAFLDELDKNHQENVAISREYFRLLDRSHLDHLTGIPDRSGLEREFVRLQKTHQSEREGDKSAIFKPDMLAFIDLDGFKTLNDIYGHEAGDKMLKNVAEILEVSVPRLYDAVGRLGGDEFIVMLHHVTPVKATEILETIRERIEQAGGDQGVTASIGLTLIDHSKDFEAALRDGDRALYQAKELGKNQVYVP